MNVSDTLNKAADLIEERGWGKGVASWGGADSGPLCLEGGILAAFGINGWGAVGSNEEFWTWPAYVAVSNYLDLDADARDEEGNNVEPLWRWNDNRGRTATEVIEVLRAAALVESARETAGLPGLGLPGAEVPA